MLRPLLHLEYENRLFSGSVGKHYILKGVFLMSKKHNFTYQLVVMAFLVALEIIFTRFLSINLPIARIGFGFLPVAITAIMFGPIWAALCYTVGDLLGMMIFPTGQFFPGFTLSAFITGLLYGILLYKKDITIKRAFFAAFIVLTCITLCLNTYWLHILMGKGFIAILPTRISEAILMLFVQGITIPFVWNNVISKVPSVKANLS